MKVKHTLLLAVILIFTMATAAAQELKCEPVFKAFEQEVVAARYDEAIALLPDLLKSCPGYDVKIYTLGSEALQHRVALAHTPEEKQPAIDSLLSLYAAQEQYFPNTGGTVNRALLLYENKLAEDSEVYKILDGAATVHPESFNNYKAIELYFNLFLKEYESGEKGISQLDFVEKYSAMAGQLSLARNMLRARQKALLDKKVSGEPLEYGEKKFLAEVPLSFEAFEGIGDNMQGMASKHFTCDALETYYSGSFEKKKDNAVWLQGLVTTMYNTKCYRAPVLEKAVAILKNKQPDTDMLFLMGNLALRNNKQQEGIDYFEQAAEMEKDEMQKARLYTRIAGIYRNIDKGQAKTYIKKALALNPSSGMNYLFLSELYSSPPGNCNLNDFEKKALVWLAIDAARKAEAAEPRYKSTVASVIKTYSKKLPTKAELKAAGYKNGDTITFGCWINETLTIPNIK